MLIEDDLKLIESLDLGPILSGAATTVSNSMVACTLDMERLSVDIQTLNRQAEFFGYLGFLGGWSRVQLAIAQSTLPDDVAARCTVLTCVAEYLCQRFAMEDA